MFKKIFKLGLLTGVLLTVFMGIYTFTVIAHTPKINPDKIYDYLSESSILLDDQGNVVDSIYLPGGNRTNIDYNDMPKHLVDAVVSIEDKTFWDHGGFNIWRIFGAIKDSIVSQKSVGGTSTVTQQLARNVYLSETKSVRSLSRKISEAYYTLVLEHSLSKEKIMEAYLNTIYLGNNAYGVQSASKAYFNKDAKDLDILESAALASLPKAPDSYALIKKVSASKEKSEKDSDKKILHENGDFIYYYNGDISKGRRDTTLKFMLENKYISQEDYDKAISENLVDKLDISVTVAPDSNSYFVDYMLEQVTKDMMEKFNYTKQEAIEKIYSGGLTIQTTLNTKAQQAIDDLFSKPGNFPKLASLKYDKNKNILGNKGEIVLSPYSTYFDDSENFVLTSDEYTESDGNITLLKDKRLKFYTTKVNGKTDYSIDFKDLYKLENGVLYTIKGGTILMPQEYKSLDENGNLVIDKKFFEKNDIVKEGTNFFTKSDNTLVTGKQYYKLNSAVRQPQAAMVITDYKNGHLKAMTGGRDVVGKKLYNRAINPRQPGSSIKPLTVYSSAIQQGKDAVESGSPMKFKEFDDKQMTTNYGDYWTSASQINDAPIKLHGKDWPKNWYNGYKGSVSLRYAVEQSINTVAVRVLQQVGEKYAIDQLKKFGVTTIVEDGDANDKNLAALALGGMTKGISPMELTEAYGTFPNGGERYDTICYTKVMTKSGETLLEKTNEKTKVIDPSVAYVMQDILLSTVQNGVAKRASLSGQVTGGKTGTTSDAVDIWFAGFTPQYSAALWIGCDVNISLSESSSSITGLWGRIMNKATSGMGGKLMSKPDDVIHMNGDYFVKGTEKGVRAPQVEEVVEEVPTDEQTTETQGNEATTTQDNTQPTTSTTPITPTTPVTPPTTPTKPTNNTN